MRGKEESWQINLDPSSSLISCQISFSSSKGNDSNPKRILHIICLLNKNLSIIFQIYEIFSSYFTLLLYLRTYRWKRLSCYFLCFFIFSYIERLNGVGIACISILISSESLFFYFNDVFQEKQNGLSCGSYATQLRMGLEISGQKEKRNLKTVFLSSFSLVHILVKFLSPCVTLVMSQQEVIHPNWEALSRNKLCFHVKKNFLQRNQSVF